MITLFAYIDAGTGGMLLQALAAGAAGLWLMFRNRIRIRSTDREASAETTTDE